MGVCDEMLSMIAECTGSLQNFIKATKKQIGIVPHGNDPDLLVNMKQISK